MGYLLPFQGKWKLLEMYKSSIAPVATLGGSKRFFYILYRNIRADLATVLTGLLFGIAPVISIAMNGILDGSVYLLASSQIGHKNTALALFPHGTLEIIAMIISSSYGLWLGVTFYERIRHGNIIDLKGNIKHSLKMIILYCIPLLIIAAFIETYITPHLYSRIP